MSRILTAITASLAACVLAILFTAITLDITDSLGNQSPIAGDPPLYHVLSSSILDGGMPYADVAVEHLPVSLIPMVGTEIVARLSGISYGFLWALLMTTIIVATAAMWANQNDRWNAGIRFTALALPLLPLVLFRLEPWIVLLSSLSIVLALHARWRSSTAVTVFATLAKGWPIALLAFPYRAGQRAIALLGFGTSALALAYIASFDGFRSGREFQGIHTETLVGSALLVTRHVTGSDPGIFSAAGAIYTSAGTAAMIVNIAIGTGIAIIGIVGITRERRPRELISPIGLLVLGIVIASPLFSAQFLFWLVPFVMFIASTGRRLFVIAATITLATIVWWVPESFTWAALVLTRNVVILSLAAYWAAATLRADNAVVSDPTLASKNGS